MGRSPGKALGMALLLLPLVGLTGALGAEQRCAWGAGKAVDQPQPSAGSVNLTCTPPSVIGAGTVAVEDAAGLGEQGVYIDAQLFSYHPKPAPVGDGQVKVAVMSMG